MGYKRTPNHAIGFDLVFEKFQVSGIAPPHWGPAAAERAPRSKQLPQVLPSLHSAAPTLHIHRYTLISHIVSFLLKHFACPLHAPSAQNNCLVDEQTAKTWHRNPSPLFPPLLELSARAVLRHKLSWEPGAIPQVLDRTATLASYPKHS